ncbi:MAG TPA: hypothetical protein VI462_13255 [Acidimicrobiia bacterium]|jgi:hypothetical protein
MGLFKGARDAMQNMGQPAGGMPGMPAGVSMPTGPMPDPAYVAKVNKIGKSGVQAPGEITAIREAGGADMSGATPHDFDVHVKPEGLAEYDTTIHQSMLATQMQNLTVGKAVTVKYDPDNPVDALLSSW